MGAAAVGGRAGRGTRHGRRVQEHLLHRPPVGAALHGALGVSPLSGPSEIGTTLVITSGLNWIPGTYTISGLAYDIFAQPHWRRDSHAELPVRPARPGARGNDRRDAGDGQPRRALFLDGYGFVVPSPRTRTVYFSAINDFTSWNPLDFFVKENYIPTTWRRYSRTHQELFVQRWGASSPPR